MAGEVVSGYPTSYAGSVPRMSDEGLPLIVAGVLLTGLVVGGLLWWGAKNKATAALPVTAAQPATPAAGGNQQTTPPAGVTVPPSNGIISRLSNPPGNAKVPPGDIIATFSGLSVTQAPTTTAAGDVPPGTLIAAVTMKGSERDSLGNIQGTFGSGGAFPVLWVSPAGDKLAFQMGVSMNINEGIPDNATLIASFQPMMGS